MNENMSRHRRWLEPVSNVSVYINFDIPLIVPSNEQHNILVHCFVGVPHYNNVTDGPSASRITSMLLATHFHLETPMSKNKVSTRLFCPKPEWCAQRAQGQKRTSPVMRVSALIKRTCPTHSNVFGSYLKRREVVSVRRASSL